MKPESPTTASRIESARAPSYAALRPFKLARSDTFPVYGDLPKVLAETEAHPSDIVAYVMATCSGYAYSDAATVAMIMARLGLEDCACRTVAQYVDAMLIDTTAYLVQSVDGQVVIVCYRGTVPLSGISWMNDLDVSPGRIELTFPDAGNSYEVHGGFYRNVRATRPDIITALGWALDGLSVLGDGQRMGPGLQALYVTGHSYGGAMAAMLAIMLRNEPAYRQLMGKLRAVYTFGAPMVGSTALAGAIETDKRLGERVFRYVYDNDAVPQLPPRDFGDFKHFGAERRFTPGAGWNDSEPRRQLGGLLDLLPIPITLLTRQLRWARALRFRASIYDHFPANYINALTPPDKRSEFGS